MAESQQRVPIRLFAYCLMPNHFHLVVSPQRDRQLSDFMRLLTMTHSKRWHAARGTAGTGHVYQGRFKAFPIQDDEHFLTVCRYVERNALRGRLVRRAESWQWSSLGDRCRNCYPVTLCEWPILRPSKWSDLVNAAEPAVDDVRSALVRSSPLGDASWTKSMAADLQLVHTLNPIGRPSRKRLRESFSRVRKTTPGVVLGR